MKVLDFAPFCGSYVREFELSHDNPVNRIIKITHEHNLHMKMLVLMLVFGPFTICTLKKTQIVCYKIFPTILRNPLNYCFTGRALKIYDFFILYLEAGETQLINRCVSTVRDSRIQSEMS